MKKCLLLLSGALLTVGMLVAQPANDNCVDAIPMNYSDTEAGLTLVSGDTRGATFDANVPNPCSGTFTMDDVWFSLTTPADLPEDGITVRTYFGQEADDVPAVGMAFHLACDDSTPLACFSSAVEGGQDFVDIADVCLEPNTTYYVRVWSGLAATDFSGTFRIGAFGTLVTDNILWTETFGDGLAGWTTFGSCGGNPDSNANAVWHFLPDGVLDGGAYANPGVGVAGKTRCDGAVGVDSDYDDTRGTAGAFGTGPCPAGGDGSQYVLESPAIYSGDWGVAGISIRWTQGLREYQSDYFVSYSIYKDGAWTDYRDYQVNDDGEFPVNSAHFTNDVQRVFMGGAQEGDSIRIRFTYNANFYYWGIDDIELIEAPCVDMRSQSNFYAIAPAYQTPLWQQRPWYPLNDIYNGGACTQNNVNLNMTVWDPDSNIVYNENLGYGSIQADSVAENETFTVPVDLASSKKTGTYYARYLVTSDDAIEGNDYNFDDNSNNFTFALTDRIYALDNGTTRALAPAEGNYDDGAPFAWVYGAYYYITTQTELESVIWGATNPSEIAGVPVNIILYKWVDSNDDEIVASAEREIIGFSEIIFDGTEADDLVLETFLENFNNPGAPITLEANTAYLVVMQYNAQDQTSFFIHASDEFNYAAINLSGDQAGVRTYASVLGLPSDGNVEGIDYGLGVNGGQTFGFDIVPVMQLNLAITDGTNDVLAADNLVKLYPNPVSQDVKLELGFTEIMDRVSVRMLDASGRMIFSQSYKNMENAVLEFNVAGLAAGTYMMHVTTDNGLRTVPFVVQH